MLLQFCSAELNRSFSSDLGRANVQDLFFRYDQPSVSLEDAGSACLSRPAQCDGKRCRGAGGSLQRRKRWCPGPGCGLHEAANRRKTPTPFPLPGKTPEGGRSGSREIVPPCRPCQQRARRHGANEGPPATPTSRREATSPGASNRRTATIPFAPESRSCTARMAAAMRDHGIHPLGYHNVPSGPRPRVRFSSNS